MKQSEQLELQKNCKAWFEEKFPELRGLFHIVPMAPKIKKRLFFPGYKATCGQTRMMFVFRERVFFFYTLQVHKHVSFYEINQLMREESAVYEINNMEDFVRHIRTILAHYQHENLGL